ncbi:hypothetical protein FD755_019581 [Muntiacus reevesi]|uniref:Large ribosomal subunit protein mL51 n=1 Tax=Muntiacus reevesi TaxID=9886 RepID=A0A5N3X829_MUNRE|nr:hypothetical protein FD755_019581 [Muntiacus reevesi]
MAGNLFWVAGCNLWDRCLWPGHPPAPKVADHWNEKRAMLGCCIQKKTMIRNRMFIDELHNLNRLISYLYKCFNQHGKHW